ncbi:MAG: glutathione S-transferase family protein [Bradyrhizobiaceae bacterium]|nr:glutathione S-transferase family protein [Bradyrhizobiaceae bacterium]
MSNRFTLYGNFRSGPTYRVGLMLSLCGEPFSYVHIDFAKGEHKHPDYLAKNRYGQVPCLYDGKHHFNQSASILQYLADATGKFGGKTPEERAYIREWMYWDFDRLTPGIFRTRVYARGIRKADAAVVDSYRADGEAGLAVLEGWLGKHAWLVGDGPTIADMHVYAAVHFAPDGGFDLSKYPGISAWAKRVEALPGYASCEAVLPKESRP